MDNTKNELKNTSPNPQHSQETLDKYLLELRRKRLLNEVLQEDLLSKQQEENLFKKINLELKQKRIRRYRKIGVWFTLAASLAVYLGIIFSQSPELTTNQPISANIITPNSFETNDKHNNGNSQSGFQIIPKQDNISLQIISNDTQVNRVIANNQSLFTQIKNVPDVKYVLPEILLEKILVSNEELINFAPGEICLIGVRDKKIGGKIIHRAK